MKHWIVTLLLILLTVAIHFYIEYLIKESSGWTVYPPLSAIPQGFEPEPLGQLSNKVRLLSVLQGMLLASVLWIGWRSIKPR